MAFSNFLSMLQSLISARHLNGEQLRSEVVQPLVSPSAPAISLRDFSPGLLLLLLLKKKKCSKSKRNKVLATMTSGSSTFIIGST